MSLEYLLPPLSPVCSSPALFQLPFAWLTSFPHPSPGPLLCSQPLGPELDISTSHQPSAISHQPEHILESFLEQPQVEWLSPSIQHGCGHMAPAVSPELGPGGVEVTCILPTVTSSCRNGLRLPNPHPFFSAQTVQAAAPLSSDCLQPVVNCQRIMHPEVTAT